MLMEMLGPSNHLETESWHCTCKQTVLLLKWLRMQWSNHGRLSLVLARTQDKWKDFNFSGARDKYQLLKASQGMKGREGWGRGFTEMQLSWQLTGRTEVSVHGGSLSSAQKGDRFASFQNTPSTCVQILHWEKPSTEGLPPSRRRLGLGREERNGKERMIRNKGMKF